MLNFKLPSEHQSEKSQYGILVKELTDTDIPHGDLGQANCVVYGHPATLQLFHFCFFLQISFRISVTAE